MTVLIALGVWCLALTCLQVWSIVQRRGRNLEWIALRASMAQLLEEHHGEGLSLDNVQRITAAKQRVERELHESGKKATSKALAHVERILK